MSKGYKQFIAEKGIGDETYHEKKTALFRVQGTSPSNMQAIQVDAVSLIKLICLIVTHLTLLFERCNLSSSTKTFLSLMLSCIPKKSLSVMTLVLFILESLFRKPLSASDTLESVPVTFFL